VAQALAAPVAHVEGRIGHHEVGLQILMQVAMEAVGVLGSEVGVDAANREVHLGEPPRGGVGLLPVDRDVAELPTMLADERLALDEHAARSAAWVVDAPLERLDHLDNQAHDASRGVELAALLAFSAGELAEEVFVDAAEDVL